MTRARTAAERLGARTTHAAVVATALVGLLFVWAAPAWGDHVVTWGIDRPDGPREIETDEPVEFVVSVMLDGSPMGDWPMTARVSDEDGEVVDQFAFTTDQQGIGRVLVPAGGVRVVELCDDDGCVYGEATIYPVGVAPTAPASQEPQDSTETPGETPTASGSDPASDPDDASPTADETGRGDAGDATRHDEPAAEATLAGKERDEDGGSNLPAWVAAFVVLTATAGGAVAWRQRSR